MASIDFWCELASTYTYLSACRVEPLAERAGVTVNWRPFSLHPMFKAVGWETSPFEIYADKGRYMWRDVAREAARYGLPFRRPSVFPRNGVPAAKIALLGVERGWGARFVQAVMRASFADDQEIAEPAVLDSILGALGLDGPAVRAEAISEGRNGALRRSTEEARSLHIFGAPTFMVGDEMFWGNDRLEQAIAFARSAK